MQSGSFSAVLNATCEDGINGIRHASTDEEQASISSAPNPNVDGVVVGVSINVWNAKHHFLERVRAVWEKISVFPHRCP
jgi:hypothetical protein